jgi:hypothetical protein
MERKRRVRVLGRRHEECGKHGGAKRGNVGGRDDALVVETREVEHMAN